MRSRFLSEWGIEPQILRPQFSPRPEKINARREFVACVNPIPEKGGRLFFRLARLFPEHRFLAVNGWYDFRGQVPSRLWRGLKNLEIMEPVDNLDPIYARTKVLVMPSQLEEGAGRVVVEAHAQGTPVLCSGHGGLPEMLLGASEPLPAPLVRPDGTAPGVRIGPWAAALGRLLDDSDFYARASRAARTAADRYFRLMDDSFEAFYETLTRG